MKIDQITEAQAFARSPKLAVVSTLVHLGEADQAIGEALLIAAANLAGRRARQCGAAYVDAAFADMRQIAMTALLQVCPAEGSA